MKPSATGALYARLGNTAPNDGPAKEEGPADDDSLFSQGPGRRDRSTRKVTIGITSNMIRNTLWLLITFLVGWCIGAWLMNCNTFTSPPSVGHFQSGTIEHSSQGDFSYETIRRMLAEGSGMRGFQQKAGLVNPKYWEDSFRPERVRAFSDWLNTTQSHPDWSEGAYSMHPPTPFPHCQVYVNHHYKYIWIKGHKVGSTAMRGTLGWLCDDHWRVPKQANFSFCAKPYFAPAQRSSMEDIERVWRDYFVFGVVRNPFTRFASGYEYISDRLSKSCRKPFFNETCLDPYKHAKTCKFEHCCPWGSIRHHIRHFTDQSTCLFTDDGLPAVDFIAETEQLQDDTDIILDVINSRRDDDLPPLEQKEFFSNINPDLKNGSTTRVVPEKYVKLYAESDFCIFSLLSIFAKDFRLLDYVGSIFRQ